MQLAAEGSATRGREQHELRPRVDDFSYGRGENEARLPWESDKIAKFVKEKVMAEGAALKIQGCLYAVFGLTNMQRRSEAKHCSSLCSQSEGDEYCDGQALKFQQGHDPERRSYSLRIRGPHFASKVSYNAGAATDDCDGQALKFQQGIRIIRTTINQQHTRYEHSKQFLCGRHCRAPHTA